MSITSRIDPLTATGGFTLTAYDLSQTMFVELDFDFRGAEPTDLARFVWMGSCVQPMWRKVLICSGLEGRLAELLL
jgi:hypothetical protein